MRIGSLHRTRRVTYVGRVVVRNDDMVVIMDGMVVMMAVVVDENQVSAGCNCEEGKFFVGARFIKGDAHK